MTPEQSPTSGEMALDLFKAADKNSPEAAVALLNEPESQMILVAWEKIAPRWRPPRGKPPERESERWEWLWAWFRENTWDGIVMDLSDATGLPPSTCDRHFRSMRHLRLLFPDGTISTWARNVIRHNVASVARPQRRTNE